MSVENIVNKVKTFFKNLLEKAKQLKQENPRKFYIILASISLAVVLLFIGSCSAFSACFGNVKTYVYTDYDGTRCVFELNFENGTYKYKGNAIYRSGESKGFMKPGSSYETEGVIVEQFKESGYTYYTLTNDPWDNYDYYALSDDGTEFYNTRLGSLGLYIFKLQ